MKKRISGGLALVGVLLTQVLTAGPSGAAPPSITKTMTTGEAVIAAFDSTDSTGCIRTQLSVFANEATNGGDSGSATVVMLRLNRCLGVVLVDGFGTTSGFDMAVANSLSTGSLNVTLTFNNVVNNTQVPMTFDGSWSAVGTNDTTVTSDKFTVGGVTFFSTSRSKERAAQAIATVTLGDEVILESHPSFTGAILSGFERTLSREKTPAPAVP